ncbi:hypothetical protein BDR03DRAFT_1018448 [Suillus americanus]|nr:hypothetical protein BDR03DRAFT_1018448 [Suillus americanus]
MAELVRELRPLSRAAPTSKPRSHSMAIRVVAHERQPMPVVESEDAMDDTDITETDVKMSDANMDELVAITSANDFPAKHWQEDTDITISPPPPVTEPTTSAAEHTPLVAEPTIYDCVVALLAGVAAMELANSTTITRIDVIEHDFDARISSMRAEFSTMQLNFNGMEGIVVNPSFPPPMMAPTAGSSATAMGMRYLTDVFDPSVAPTANLVGVAQALASRLFACPDVQGSMFISGQPSYESAQAGLSSAPAVQSQFSVSLAASETHSLP